MPQQNASYAVADADNPMPSDIERLQMEQKLIDYCMKKINRLKTDRSNWELVWSRIANAVSPWRWISQYASQEEQAQKSRTTKFKSAISAEIIDNVSAFYARTANPSIEWAQFVLDGTGTKPIEDSPIWLQFRNEVLLPEFYKVTRDAERNFNESTFHLLYEATTYGTGCRFCKWSGGDMRPDGLQNPVQLTFETPPINKVFFEHDGFNRIVFAGQDMKLTLAQAASLWGQQVIMEAFGIQSLEHWYAQCDTDEKDFVHVVLERNDYCPQMPFTRFCGFVMATSPKRIIANTENTNLMPYSIYKLLSMPGDYYGRSRLFDILDDIEYCDQLLNDYREMSSFAIMPAILTAEKGILPEAGLIPGANIAGGIDADGRVRVQPLLLGQGFQMLEHVIQLKQQEIHNHMLFGNMLSPQDTAGMTETQVQEIMVSHEHRIKPIIMGWQQHDMQPVCKHIMNYLFHPLGGGIEFPYEGLRIDPADINEDPVSALKIEYSGLLGREQRKYDSLQITRTVGEIMQMVQMTGDASLLDKLDSDKVADMKIKLVDIPEFMARPDSEVQAIRQQRQQRQAEQEQNETALKSIEAVATLDNIMNKRPLAA
jgi:hypothetical protein